MFQILIYNDSTFISLNLIGNKGIDGPQGADGSNGSKIDGSNGSEATDQMDHWSLMDLGADGSG